MKRHILYLITALLLIPPAVAKEGGKKVSSPSSALGVPSSSLMNINNISAWYSNNSESERNPMTSNSGLTFPRGTATAVYTSGLMIGALSNDNTMASNQPRVTGFSYNSGFAPGAILGIRTGIVENISDPSVRIWRIRRDYATADLTLDAAEYFQKQTGSVTAADIQLIRDQYKKDWQEWPASKGAPFYDANNDGIYTPQFETVGGKEVPKLFPAADEPGAAKGDQVIWYVCNDIAAGDSPWKTKPMGLEQQVTIWGYKSEGGTANTLYKKIKVIYKGTSQTPVGALLTDMYFTHWSDPDLGNAGDDYTGCDTTLSLGFVFNSQAVDAEYAKFGLVPPALGYDFLQGPLVPSPGDTAIFDLKRRPGYKNLGMTSFVYFAPGDQYSDPPFSINGSSQWYSMMQGLPPTPQPPPYPAPIVNPSTGQPTRFWLSGDPVSRTGWIDDGFNQPGDRRFLQSSGPFTMALGDTQEIVVGVLTAIGNDYLNSVTALKEYDRTVQAIYNALFESIPPALKILVSYPTASEATIGMSATAQPGNINSVTASVNGSPVQLYDDGTHGDSTASDGKFYNSVTIARKLEPISVDLSYTDKTNKSYTITRMIDRVTTAGPLVISKAPVLFDNINNNGVVNNGEYVQFNIALKNNSAFPLNGVKAVISSGTGVSNDFLFGSIAVGAEAAMGSQAYRTFRLPIQYAASEYIVTVSMFDANGNTWTDKWSFPVVQYASIDDSLENAAANVVGQNDGRIGFVLYDPAAAGQIYDIWYGGTPSIQNWTVVKCLADADYAEVSAALKPSNVVPPVTTQPGATGAGIFTINDAKNQVKYSLSVFGLSGAVTNAFIKQAEAGVNGPAVYSLTFNGTSAAGTWAIPDSLIDDFTAGNLSVEVQTAANPAGEIRGQIANGMVLRQNVPAVTAPLPGVFNYSENRLTGFSLFVAPAPKGIKSVRQTAPTAGNVLFSANPENTYRIISFAPQTNFAGTKSTSADLEIRFNSATNWGMMIPNLTNPSSSQVHFVKIPFAVYLDTVRVWPVIYNVTASDSSWNITGNQLYDGKPTFDRILGIVDIRDGVNTDLTYYSPLNTAFPPTAVATKSRLLNSANHVYKDIVVVNQQGDGNAPAQGTTINFAQYKAIRPGDIKSITLQPLEVRIVEGRPVPQEYELSQNYPNPFNPSTRIEFSVPKQSRVTLKIYDVIGREIAVLMNDVRSAGRYSAEWNGRDQFGHPAASGIYFYSLSSGQYVQTKKMVLLK
jgi:hypothetical protein